MKILIVDDSSTSRSIMKVALDSLKHESTLTADGMEALKALKGCLFDVVISDRIMPKMDGLELCRQVRATPETAHTYFILVTGADERSDFLKAKAAGADAFLRKPLDLAELKLRLVQADSAVERRRQGLPG